uniref:Uncharacterized protein n=1 Tax=Nelumbo nucifera TaxID=4432 RepID=A0A822YVH4_NELNU|nr:TPA_asm: hypothetical protein HUJ06_005755 [Nelumbo nucifera]
MRKFVRRLEPSTINNSTKNSESNRISQYNYSPQSSSQLPLVRSNQFKDYGSRFLPTPPHVKFGNGSFQISSRLLKKSKTTKAEGSELDPKETFTIIRNNKIMN